MTTGNTFSELKRSVINELSLSFEAEGFSPLCGKIYTLLVFAADPLSLQQIADELGVSKAAVSVQARMLERVAMCQKLAVGNDRRDYYYIPDNFSLTVIHNATRKINEMSDRMAATIESLHRLEHVEPDEKAEYEAAKRRFTEIYELYSMINAKLEGLEEEWNEKRQKIFRKFSDHTEGEGTFRASKSQ
ncbi:GbsR/MarR family transcriptional regulator [Paenibacillus ginsengihumi]|jgi:DNA-binding transcriptional regulator GbsR (MarR family)|uniref:GbsR/MarR family transcriptional regulator n=1 Tax=Paenibacillus ginsengihumi TaxID=431596 RepID=UPI00037E0DB2|nr:hypothetical protein [Paenibacillus ginsengihumi]